MRETTRADGSFKNGNTIGVLRLNLYGNPSGTYYYVDGLLEFLRKIKAQMNEAEVCLIRIELSTGNLIIAIAFDDFLAIASTLEARNHFYEAMDTIYDIKRLERPVDT